MTADGTAVVVARVPRELRGWRSELGYGLYLARRHLNWDAFERYPRSTLVTTRFVIPLETIAELDRLKTAHGLPRYKILTVALHNLSRDRLARPPAGDSAVVRPMRGGPGP